MNSKENHKFANMKKNQARSMLVELWEKLDPAKTEEVLFTELMGVLDREYQTQEDKLQRWNDIPLTVGQKDNLLKKYLSDSEKEDLLKRLL